MVTFPKIGNDWPDLAQPPEPGAQFDYSRWENAKATLKLFYVKFDATYSDVLYFDTDAERDTFYNDYGGGASSIVTLTSGFDKFPLNTLRIPIPYNDAQRYNYCFVEITLPADGLQYQTEYRMRRYYFITDSKQLAPSTTEIKLEYDVWTNDARHMDISSAVLTRGHYAMQVNATEYLRNPAASSRYLLAKDVDFSNGGTACGTGISLPRMNDERSICVLLGIAPDMISAIGTIDYVGNPGYSFSDIPNDRNGYQKGIMYNHLAAHTSLNITPTAPDTNGDTLSQVYLYEIENVTNWFNYVINHMPHMLQTLKCVCAVPKALISRDTEFTFGDTKMWSIAKADDTTDITLDTDMFGFDADVKELAKLYTYPYSWLEYQKPDGTKTDIRIETIGGTFAQRRAFSGTDPLQIETYIVKGANTSHTWYDLKGEHENVTLPSDLYDTLDVFDVPCIGLDVSGFTDAGARLLDIDHDTDVLAAQYINSVNSTNNARENALDSDTTSYANAVDSSATANANALASDATQHTNSDASANTENANALATNDRRNQNELADNSRVQSNAERQSDNITHVEIVNGYTLEHTNDGIRNDLLINDQIWTSERNFNLIDSATTAQASIHNAQIAKLGADRDADIAYSDTVAAIQNDAVAMQQTMSNAGTMVNGALNGISHGGEIGALVGAAGGPLGSAGGALIGAGVGLVAASVSCAVSNFTASIAISANDELTQRASGYTTQKALNAITEADAIYQAQSAYQIAQAVTSLNIQNYLAQKANEANDDIITNTYNAKEATEEARKRESKAIRDNNKQVDDHISNDTKTTNDENANRTLATALANSARTHGTGDANANRTKATADANAARTKATDDANATYTRNTSIENAQRTFGTAYEGIMRDMDTLRLQRVTRGSESGNPSAANFGRDVNRIVPRTQLKPCIRMAGETFARFGYAYGGTISFSGFKLPNTRRFAYWQLDNVWYSGDTTENAITGTMRDILHRGVTVWYDYGEMCTGSVFDN